MMHPATYALVLAVFSTAQAAAEIFDIPLLHDVSIDGSADDWVARGTTIEVMADEKGTVSVPSDHDPRLRIGWNEEGLLLLMEIEDEEIHEHNEDRRLFLGDSVEIFLARHRDARDYVMLILSPGVSEHKVRVKTYWFDERVSQRLSGGGAVLAVQAASAATPRGYVIEALVPWSNVALEAVEGTEFALQIYAMDKDLDDPIKSVAWYPKMDAHLGRTHSMQSVRLSERLSERITAAARVDGTQLRVTAVEELAGSTVNVYQGTEMLVSSKLEYRDGRASTMLNLGIKPSGSKKRTIEVFVDDVSIGKVDQLPASALVSGAVDNGNLRFYQNIFSGDQFPQFGFESADAVRETIGETAFQVRYFDASWHEVTEPSLPGRYGAIIEVQSQDTCLTRRYFTLWRTTDKEEVRTYKVAPWLFPKIREAEILGSPSNERIDGRLSQSLDEADAIMRGGKTSADALEADQEWWVTLKRNVYNAPQMVLELPQAVPPTSEDQQRLRIGTCEDAQVPRQLAASLDEACEKWASAVDESGFTIMVARNGVVFYSKAYGRSPDGKAMTTETPSPIGSITKLFTGLVTLMFVDQELMDVDAPVEAVMPLFKGKSGNNSLTVRMLLTHTSGLKKNTGDQFRDLEERITSDLDNVEVPSPYLYDGQGYALCMKLLEFVSGKTRNAIYRDLLLNPLMLEETEVFDSHSEAVSTASNLGVVGQMILNGGSYGGIYFMSPQTLASGYPRQLVEIFGPQTEEFWGLGFYGRTNDHMIGRDGLGHPSSGSSYLRVDLRRKTVFSVASEASNRYLRGSNRANLIKMINALVDEYDSRNTRSTRDSE